MARTTTSAPVAALMAAARPDMSAVELRANLLGSARATKLPVTAGYVDAANAPAVPAANPASSSLNK